MGGRDPVQFRGRRFRCIATGRASKPCRPQHCARTVPHTAYDWLEENLDQSPWTIGEQFTLADCAAAPSLFYADWVEEIDDRYPQLKGYRARLLAHRVVARAVDEARAYRPLFPLGAPDRD
jgi:glutathione S-transferase